MTNSEYLLSYFLDHQLTDWRILDATKLEVFRIITLGITGFDNALSLNSLEESSMSLKSIREILRYYVPRNNTLIDHITAAIAYVDQEISFDAFDRATFITSYANQISSQIAQLEEQLPGQRIKYNRMLRQDVKTLFDNDAFNVNAFSPGPEYQMTDAKVALGEKLFFDVALSGNRQRSCGTCHNPNLAFTDGLVKHSQIHNSSKLLKRNTPTVINTAFQSNYFDDMRALTLEDQIQDVIVNEQEMDGSITKILQYVSKDKHYQSLFAQAFPSLHLTGIAEKQLTNALASYIRSLSKLNSRFDRYMRGQSEELTKQELAGFNLFMGKAKCATCHFLPLFNGVTPPKYISSEAEVLGVPISQNDSTVDNDIGYYAVNGIDSYQHAFKIPSVRNILKTAPYMHNGVYATLAEVMEFYNKGGAVGVGVDLENQTLSGDKLLLTEMEKEDIIAFLGSLESEE